jgi:hypothetical protein
VVLPSSYHCFDTTPNAARQAAAAREAVACNRAARPSILHADDLQPCGGAGWRCGYGKSSMAIADTGAVVVKSLAGSWDAGIDSLAIDSGRLRQLTNCLTVPCANTLIPSIRRAWGHTSGLPGIDWPSIAKQPRGFAGAANRNPQREPIHGKIAKVQMQSLRRHSWRSQEPQGVRRLLREGPPLIYRSGPSGYPVNCRSGARLWHSRSQSTRIVRLAGDVTTGGDEIDTSFLPIKIGSVPTLIGNKRLRNVEVTHVQRTPEHGHAGRWPV